MPVASYEHIHPGAKNLVALAAVAVGVHRTVAAMAASHELDEAEKC